MKRTILLSLLVVVGAGVAVTHLLPAAHSNPSPPAASAPLSPSQAVAPVSTASTVVASPPAPAATGDTPATVQKASLDTRQAPVPLLMRPRAPVNVPATDTLPAADAKAMDGKPADPSTDPAADIAGQSAAKAAIEADGYKGVKVLNKGENGVWRATALRGRTTVSVTVDASGSVSAD